MVPAILFLLTILFPIILLSIFTIAGVALIGGGAFENGRLFCEREF